MTSPRNLSEHFLLAARNHEISNLEQLAHSSELVAYAAQLVHELQRERGISNVFLASAGAHFGKERQEQVAASGQAETDFRAYLERVSGERRPLWSSARLYNRLAQVMLQLDELEALRRAVAEQKLDATDSTEAYSRLIGSLLAVIFEAADIATDPEITRVLVALFNFMQAKEYTGLERAWGSVGLAARKIDKELVGRLQHLRESQQRCLETFLQFAGVDQCDNWKRIDQDPATAELARLRAMIDAFVGEAAVPDSISEIWFAVITTRIDRMHQVESELREQLLTSSRARVEAAKQAMRSNRFRLQQESGAEPVSPLSMLLDAPTKSADAPASPEVNRSLYQLLQEQSAHLQQMSDELNEAREALRERKVIERAKGVLMQYQGLSEEEAYRRLRESAMQSNCRVADVAKKVIGAVDSGANQHQ
ncbi:nitrate regulatory protein [Marinobacterium litorale]|uniref:nitrate regulatory protein n=1 Tax=Marinobacterium litorale TaxID=404770 RepID=UPI00041D49C8|nr:nitrate regulatory protein [Marinobacterium litorale]